MKTESPFTRKISLDETNINLNSDIDIKNLNIEEYIINERNHLKDFIVKNPYFAKTLEPYKLKSESNNNEEIPKIIKLMIEAANIAKVGPTATIAGTISELTLDYLIKNGSKYSIVDNGGDIAFLNNYDEKKVVFGIYAGDSPLSGKIGLEFKGRKNQTFGICSSSASVGYSLSYGRSDSVTVIASQASIADGLATSIGNKVNGKLDKTAVENGLEFAEEFKEHFIGVLIIVGETIGTIGKFPKIVETK